MKMGATPQAGKVRVAINSFVIRHGWKIKLKPPAFRWLYDSPAIIVIKLFISGFWKQERGRARERGVGGGHTKFYCGWSNEPPEITVTFSPRPLTPRSRAQLHPRLQGLTALNPGVAQGRNESFKLSRHLIACSLHSLIPSVFSSFPPWTWPSLQSRMFFLWTSFGTRCLKCCDKTIFIVICVSMSMYFIARENNGQSSLLTWFVFFPLLYHP